VAAKTDLRTKKSIVQKIEPTRMPSGKKPSARKVE